MNRNAFWQDFEPEGWTTFLFRNETMTFTNKIDFMNSVVKTVIGRRAVRSEPGVSIPDLLKSRSFCGVRQEK